MCIIHTHIHTHTHTHTHTDTPRMQGAAAALRPQPILVVHWDQPTWVGVGPALNPTLQYWEVVQLVACNSCCRDRNGNLLIPPRDHRIHQGAWYGHSTGQRHALRVNRLPLGQPQVVAGAVDRLERHRCHHCSLDFPGNTRYRYWQMSPVGLAEHLGNPEHLRRVGDGRMARYTALHGNGPHQRVPGDAW